MTKNHRNGEPVDGQFCIIENPAHRADSKARIILQQAGPLTGWYLTPYEHSQKCTDQGRERRHGLKLIEKVNSDCVWSISGSSGNYRIKSDSADPNYKDKYLVLGCGAFRNSLRMGEGDEDPHGVWSIVRIAQDHHILSCREHYDGTGFDLGTIWVRLCTGQDPAAVAGPEPSSPDWKASLFRIEKVVEGELHSETG